MKISSMRDTSGNVLQVVLGIVGHSVRMTRAGFGPAPD